MLLLLPGVSKRPVPSETTHSKGVLGHKDLHSWIASAVGLLISRPPSCAQNTTSAMLETLFRGFFLCQDHSKRNQLIGFWNPQNLSRILTVHRWHFLKTSDANKKNRSMCSYRAACKSTKHCCFFPPVSLLPSHFQSDWLWYRTTAQECFRFGSIVYPRQWGSNWRGCGDCWIGMRLRGRGAEGWQQDQTHRG